MKFVGADLHKKSISFCVVALVNGKSTVEKRQRIACRDADKLVAFFQSLGEFEVTVEATIGYDWFAALAERHARRVVVAHPGHLRIIAESTRKTDKIDAQILAEFLARDMIPESWRPTDRVRSHRSLTRYRYRQQCRATSLKNTMRAILTRYNFDRPNLFTRVGWRAVLQLPLLTEEKWLLEQLHEELGATQKRLRASEARLVEFAQQAPPSEREARAVLATMPSVGLVTIETLLAELGDWQRFSRGDEVVSYAGLDPGIRESDSRRKNLRLSKAGSPQLRWIMVQWTQRVTRTVARWRALYRRLAARIDKKKAICAIARRLLLVVYAMLRDGKAYAPPAVSRAIPAGAAP